MAIPRGSVNHKINYDLKNFFQSFLSKKLSLKLQKNTSKKLESELNNIFENKYFYNFSPYARTSLYAVLSQLNLKNGSQILMTPFNISPMIDVIDNLGLKPVFVDINLIDFGPNYEELEKYLKKPNVKCFLLTYLFGYVPDIELITSLCRKYNVFLIEDISQNIGSKFKNKLLGTYGTASIYSSSFTKYLDSYNGSFVLTKSNSLNKKINVFLKSFLSPDPKRIRSIIFKTLLYNIALNRLIFSLITYPIFFILFIFRKKFFNKLLGPSIKGKRFNKLPIYYFEALSEMQGRVMLEQISQLKELLSKRRCMAHKAIKAVDKKYECLFTSFKKLKTLDNENFQTYWQFILKVENTEDVRKKLFLNQIETGITNLPDLSKLCSNEKINTKTLLSEYIFLPLHEGLNVRDYRNIFKIILKK